VAVQNADRLAVRTRPQRESAAPLLQLIDETLAEVGCRLHDLDAMVALQGPGSFTGLRVGLALTLGLHQGSRLPAGAVSTLEVLGAAVSLEGSCVACVDALRGHWFVQRFEDGRVRSAPERVAIEELRLWEPTVWIGAGVGSTDLPGERIEPPPLAPIAAALVGAERVTLDPATLTRPLYLQDPALTPLSTPKRVGA
jgi:tRNA threonylcarbamoyladenosine biosynthesis protein TsaB